VAVLWAPWRAFVCCGGIGNRPRTMHRKVCRIA
jgi:hypothetical protein